MANLALKLIEVQAEVPTVGFDASNPHFKNRYATLGKVLATVLPALQKRGVLLTQPLVTSVTGHPALLTKFTDTEDGETVEFTTPLIAEKNTPQGIGSAVTYYRRYAVLSALGIVGDEDDDAEAAEPQRSGSTSRPSSRRTF